MATSRPRSCPPPEPAAYGVNGYVKRNSQQLDRLVCDLLDACRADLSGMPVPVSSISIRTRSAPTSAVRTRMFPRPPLLVTTSEMTWDAFTRRFSNIWFRSPHNERRSRPFAHPQIRRTASSASHLPGSLRPHLNEGMDQMRISCSRKVQDLP
jgi:hypothetical protein